MTDLLKDTLTERASGTVPPGLDLDAIITTGDRRIRRRRAAAVAGTALITLAILATGLTLTRGPDQPPVATPFTERRATYATGSDIHYGPEVISIAPKKINAFVQTDVGFVFTATGGGVFLADGKQVRRLADGPGELSPLVASSQGHLVGWVEGFNDRYESVIYDVAAGRELVRTALGNQISPNLSLVEAPRIVAIEGGHAYLGTLKGVYRWDLKTNQHERFVGSVLPSAIRTLTADRYLLDTDPRLPVGPEPITLQLKDIPGNNTLSSYPGKYGYLSPTAKYLLTAAPDPGKITPPPAALKLFDTTTHKQLPFTHPTHPRLFFNQWLTDDTFTAAGVRVDPARLVLYHGIDLLTCSTKSLTCHVTTPAFSTLTFTTTPPRTAPFALPIGTPIYWLYG